MSLCCGLRFRRRNASFESESWAYGEKKVEKVHLDSQKTRAKSPRLFQRMLWNLHDSDDSIQFDTDWKHISQLYDIWFSYDQHWGNTIWIRFESDKEKWEKCIPPWVTCLTLVFINARQSDRSHRHQRRGSTTTLFQSSSMLSFGTCFLIQASSMCRQRCHGCCHLRHPAKRTAKRLCILAFFGFSHFSLWFFFRKVCLFPGLTASGFCDNWDWI